MNDATILYQDQRRERTAVSTGLREQHVLNDVLPMWYPSLNPKTKILASLGHLVLQDLCYHANGCFVPLYIDPVFLLTSRLKKDLD